MPQQLFAEMGAMMDALQFIYRLMILIAAGLGVVYLIGVVCLCLNERKRSSHLRRGLPKTKARFQGTRVRIQHPITSKRSNQTMKRILFMLILALATTAFAFGQTMEKKAAPGGKTKAMNRQQDEQAIVKLQQDWLTALLKGDPAPMQRILADDYLGVDASGKASDKAQAIAAIRPTPASPSPAPAPEVKVDDSKLRFYGDNAVSTGLLTIKVPNASTSLRYSIVWVKQRGQWQAVSSQVTNPANNQALATNTSQAEQELTQLAEALGSALKKRDFAALDRIFADDFIGTSIEGVAYNKGQLMNFFKANPGNLDSETEDIQTRIDRDLAVANFISIRKGTRQGQAFTEKVRETHTLVRRQGRWQVLASSAVRLQQ